MLRERVRKVIGLSKNAQDLTFAQLHEVRRRPMVGETVGLESREAVLRRLVVVGKSG